MAKQAQNDQESVGFLGGIKQGIQTVAPGLSLSKVLGDVGAELSRLGTQGQAEVASALFQGHTYVPYGPGQNLAGRDGTDKQPETQPDKEVEKEQERGGREM